MGENERGIRAAGSSLVAAGVLFAGVVTYLYAVLMPFGLDIDMFDDTERLLTWVSGHLALYLTLYLLYAVQQVALLAAPLLLWRHLPVSSTRPWIRALATAAASASIVLVFLSNALLIMSTHTAVQYWGLAESVADRTSVLMMFDATADLAKGARLISEPLLGIWLVWIAILLVRSSAPRGQWPWAAVGAVGVWAAVVGIWKLIDPLMPYEDWVAFVIAAALVAAGFGVLRRLSNSDADVPVSPAATASPALATP